MQLKYIYLRNFRNFAEADFIFGPKLNVIHGENGRGKTNLLEAIILLSIGRSFRTPHLNELIREKEAGFYLEAELVRDAISHQIRLSFDGQNKKLQVNGNTHAHFSPLLGLLPSVLYATQNGELITGSPLMRRRFLDLQLAQSDPLYVHHLARFYRSMKQRNCLLRSRNLETIESWETEMSIAAAYIQQERKKLIESLIPILSQEGNTLSNEIENHEIGYLTSYPSQSSDYLEQLKKMRKRDQELKQTTSGPHRDDVSFLIDGKLARSFASEGQKKTSLAALKISEWRHLGLRSDTLPLMAVDDLGQPLDSRREERFFQTLETFGQVFITMTRAPHLLEKNVHPIEMSAI